MESPFGRKAVGWPDFVTPPASQIRKIIIIIIILIKYYIILLIIVIVVTVVITVTHSNYTDVVTNRV